MASKRRGGFRPPELRGTLGTLLRTTTGVVRDALERGARKGRARLDVARASLDSARATHRRHDALADLGELILDLIRRGEIDLAELPEARDLVRELDQLDEDTAAADLDAEPDLPPRPASRRRFDDRGRSRRPDADDDADDSRRRPRRDSDDGTVSSGAVWRPTLAERPTDRRERATVPDRPGHAETNSSRAPTKQMKGIWRPQIDDAPPIPDSRDRPHDRSGRERPERPERPERAERHDRDTERDPADRPARDTDRDPADRPARDTDRDPADRPARDTDRDPTDRSARDTDRDRPASGDRGDRRPSVPRDPARKGGISFDDEDLADYMHPDDVPPKTPPNDPDDHEA